MKIINNLSLLQEMRGLLLLKKQEESSFLRIAMSWMTDFTLEFLLFVSYQYYSAYFS